MYIGMVGLIAAFIVVAMSLPIFSNHGTSTVGIIISVALFLASAFLGVSGQSLMDRQYSRALAEAMRAVKDHVEGALDEEWQRSRGIR